MHLFARPSHQHVINLLQACSLPTEDLSPDKLELFLGCGDACAPGGVAGLEIFGRAGLLRSLAVAEAFRGCGCGRALVDGIEAAARSRGVTDLYLLTDTAEGFFARLGYTAITRTQAPDAIRATDEFNNLCPGSAVLMVKSL